jgi:PHS family inorganic phosphate transporter-like MFS transporter
LRLLLQTALVLLTMSTAVTPPSKGRSRLEEFEQSDDRPPFILTYTEIKLLGIAGVGFFLDAYDLFIINPVSTMLQYRLYGGKSLPAGPQGFIKAAANVGSVIGQFGFGFAADALGRKAVYGKELMLVIFATIMSISDPTGDISPNSALIWLGVWRIVLGIGVGGDYPMSASVTSDRTNIRKRGTMLAFIFANQGWGSLVGSLVTVVVLSIYKPVMNGEGHTSKVDGVWRIVIGLSLIPAFGTLYQRLTLPESTRYLASRERPQDAEAFQNLEVVADELDEKKDVFAAGSDTDDKSPTTEPVAEILQKKAHFPEFMRYFSKWRHAKLLIGTCSCWFFLDIAFYGINLNQNVVLQQIGFAGKTGTAWERLYKLSVGGLIITALGFVPGYYVTVLTIEKLGRKWIQIQGFLLAALFLAILAGKFHTLGNAAFIVNFTLLQFFFNFGANATTYIYPAELFPTRYRAFAHGISAAFGKFGAIISASAFSTLTNKLGTPAVLWIFFACCLAGAVCSLLLPEVRGRDPDVILAEEIREGLA